MRRGRARRVPAGRRRAAAQAAPIYDRFSARSAAGGAATGAAPSDHAQHRRGRPRHRARRRRRGVRRLGKAWDNERARALARRGPEDARRAAARESRRANRRVLRRRAHRGHRHAARERAGSGRHRLAEQPTIQGDDEEAGGDRSGAWRPVPPRRHRPLGEAAARSECGAREPRAGPRFRRGPAVGRPVRHGARGRVRGAGPARHPGRRRARHRPGGRRAAPARGPAHHEPQAYDAYLRGREVTERDWDAADLRTAARMFERAVALDSNFALAHAWLSATYVTMYWNYVDRSPEQLTRAKAEADRAQRLNPDSYEAHGALRFYYYHGLGDYSRALAEYAAARRSRPNDPWPPAIISGIKADQGQWSEALTYGHEAVVLDPLNGGFVAGLGDLYSALRQFAAADSYYDRALALSPQSVSAHLTKAIAYLNQTGNLAGARRLMPDVARNIAPTGLETQVITLSDVALLLDDTEQARVLRLGPAALDGDTAALTLAKAMIYRGRRQLSVANDHFDFARITLAR